MPSAYLIPGKLETGRLLLRMFTMEDWKDIHEYYGAVGAQFEKEISFRNGIWHIHREHYR